MNIYGMNRFTLFLILQVKGLGSRFKPYVSKSHHVCVEFMNHFHMKEASVASDLLRQGMAHFVMKSFFKNHNKSPK